MGGLSGNTEGTKQGGYTTQRSGGIRDSHPTAGCWTSFLTLPIREQIDETPVIPVDGLPALHDRSWQ